MRALWMGMLPALLAAAPVRAVVVQHNSYEGPITPVAAEYMVGAIEEAAEADCEAVLLELDTPGGLDSSMRDIVKAILNSPIPVIVYVSPPGSRAASAGVFLTMAAHVAAMAPGTNIGSASPVSMMGAQMDSTMARKVMHDAVAYLEGIAQERGRSTEWARRFVQDADNLPAERALEENVIDFVARDRRELLEKADGMVVKLPTGERTLELRDAVVVERHMGLRHRILATLANPTLAYLLLLLGIYGLFFELSNPGSILPGVLGSIAILLALFAFQALPVRWAGLGLIGVAVILFVLEIYVTSFGLLTVSGVTALALGSVMLFDASGDWARVSMKVIVPSVGFTALFFGACVWLAVRGQRRRVTTGKQALVGERARVIRGGVEGKVVLHGEVWDAVSEEPLSEGQRVEVTAVEGRTVRVRIPSS